LAKNEEGEFELILGNRQLISVFLIVVILLGVFFSMGYIVGRNSAPASAESARVSKTGPDPSLDAAPSTAPATTPQEPSPVAPAPVATHPAQSAPEPVIPAPVAAKETKSKPSPTERASVTSDPVPGDYWQVVATARPDAEIITEALLKKGFHAVIAPAPRDGVFRVLVGPLRDAATQSQTRSQLESAGFKNPLMRKY
jgi:cell division septation protein DedD